MKRIIVLLACLLVIIAGGCNSKIESQQEPNLDFFAQIQTNPNNEVEIKLQLSSQEQNLELDPEFSGRMVLVDSSGELRSEAMMTSRPAMNRGEIAELMSWRGILEPGIFQLDWSSTNYGGVKISFEVMINSSDQIYIGDQTIVPYAN